MSEYLRSLIREISIVATPRDYRLQSGKTVGFGCHDCINDLELRIDDNRHHRDQCDPRTDAREHYNGILKVLRRELRSARKLADNE